MNIFPGAEAVAAKGWWRVHKILILRRLSQLSVLGLFLSGSWFGIEILAGNLSASLVLDTVPLTDPLLLLQVLLTGHLPEMLAVTGALLVTGFYVLVGGRVYCSWVCPLNMVTDAAGWLNRWLDIKPVARFSRQARYWLLGMVLALAALSGSLVWEWVNPVSMLHRGILFGMGLGWLAIVAVFLFDVFITPRGWCGHLCPMGAFYGLLGKVTPLRVTTLNRAACNTCMDCFYVCPEPQVITAPLKDMNYRPLIDNALCTNCGRCIEVCSKEVFAFSVSRYQHSQSQKPLPVEGAP